MIKCSSVIITAHMISETSRNCFAASEVALETQMGAFPRFESTDDNSECVGPSASSSAKATSHCSAAALFPWLSLACLEAQGPHLIREGALNEKLSERASKFRK